MDKLSDWKSCARPAHLVLAGAYCRLEALTLGRHGDALFAASMAPGADERFRYLFNTPQNRAGFDSWLA